MTGQDLTGFYGSSPVIGVDGSIYLGSGFNLHAYKQNGTRRWFVGSFPTGDLIDSSPAVGIDGTIYFGSNDGNLYALDPLGRKRWSYRNEQGVISSPVLDGDGTIYIVNPGYSSYEGSLVAVNRDGTRRWILPTDLAAAPYPNFPPPAVGPSGILFFNAPDGWSYAIKLSDSAGGSPWPMYRRDNKHAANSLPVRMRPEIPSGVSASQGTRFAIRLMWDAAFRAIRIRNMAKHEQGLERCDSNRSRH
jgi:outer membrane protein assembly factor BamB